MQRVPLTLFKMSDKTFFEEPKLLDTLVSFDNDASTGNLIIKRSQEIPHSFIDRCREIREGNRMNRTGFFLPVASIPTEVADDLKRRIGIDVTRAPYKDVIRILKREGLDYFILTEKAF